MAKTDKTDKDAQEEKGDPSDMFVATENGVHGRIIKIGQSYSRGQLIGLGGFVPDYFKREGTTEANEAIMDAEADDDGFKNNKERVMFLAAKGVHVSERLGKPKLQELIAKHASGAPSGDPLAV